MTTTTGIGVDPQLDDDANEFLTRWFPEGDPDAPKPKKQEPSEPQEEPEEDKKPTPEPKDEPEDSEETPEDEGDEEGEEEEPKKAYVEDDGAYLKIKVGDDEHEVPVKDLKRLWGQEASITQKGQEVANRRSELDKAAQAQAAALDVLIKRATAKADQYRNIDFLALAKDQSVTAEELTALRKLAQEAHEEETFLKSELGNFQKALGERQQRQMAEQAVKCKEALENQDSPHYIEGFNKETYQGIVQFAVSEGIDAQMVANLVDPAAIKILHMASLYKKGLAKVTTQKVNKTVKKVIKTSNTMTKAQRTGKPGPGKAMQQLKAKGDTDSAAEAFLERWQSADSDD